MEQASNNKDQMIAWEEWQMPKKFLHIIFGFLS
jgi:hypothetical protein